MLNWLKRTGAPRNNEKPAEIWRALGSEGMRLGTFETVGAQPGAVPLHSPTLPALITQLHDEGYAVAVENSAHIPWEALYNLLEDSAYAQSVAQLELPPSSPCVPELQSRNTLTDRDFSIGVVGWRDEFGRLLTNASRTGALLSIEANAHLLGRRAWETVEQIARFHARPNAERDDASQRMRWGQIRRSAVAANARLDQFLYKSVVLTPETIDINLRKTDVGGTHVVEIMPTFEGAPENWLATFDSYKTIPGRYDINTPNGIVQVLVTPEVRTVLDNIRRLDGRRVAGSRAEAFLLNPFAALGEDASAVIDEHQFELARIEADILFDHFTAVVNRDALAYPETVGLVIETPQSNGQIAAEERFFADNGELEQFIHGAQRAIDHDRQLFAWEGYDFELLGDSTSQLELLQVALDERQQPRILVRYTDVYDLSAYTSRVNDIGIEQPYYSPYIAKKSAEWWPENLVNLVVYTPEGETEPVAVPMTDDVRDQLRAKVDEAATAGHTSVELPGFRKPIPVLEARNLLDAFTRVRKEVEDEGHGPADKDNDTQRLRSAKPKQLLLKPNVNAVDYEEIRHDILTTFAPVPSLPTGLRPTTHLLPHQEEGVAWLQHLFRHAPTHCRGAVVADDMGLGKTLQLLTFLARVFENNPDLPPALVVAPVSLLENWVEEIDKFFEPGTFRPLVAYGDNLASLRVPRSAIDEQLRKENLVRFLKPGWIGNANVVLTTYETLRDLEFSFAAEKWSVMACDEAQKIKNPNAMVTRAAKKQNVTFKIACTGTPVENTLVDLWCLFDLIQAGHLGALNDFGKRYRKPIEAETEEENHRVAELRRLIEPQILRRLKSEVATLPPKHLVASRILMSNLQRTYYTNAVNSFKASKDKTRGQTVPSPFKNHLGLLQYLRSLCTTPHAPGQGRFKPQPLEQFRVEAPKLGWLLETLEDVRAKGEKAIVFAEFRETQQMLAHYIKEVFGFSPDIINGDVTASARHVASRQKRIKAFQAKPGFGVIILSPVAVGFGVNVQGANHVIHYTRNWNPAKEDQATDRSYRIGQTRDVWVYLPIVYAEDFMTFDVRLDQLLEEKRKLAKDMLNGSGTVMPGDWDIQDIIAGGSNDSMFNGPVTMDEVLRMDWDYFEALIAAIWQKKGFRTVYRTPTQDEGVDVVAFTGQKGDLIQCKSSGIDNAALNDQGIKDVLLGDAEYRLRHPGVNFTKCTATNQFFNNTAQERAQKNNVTLVNQKDIEKLLGQYPITDADVQRFLYAYWDEAA